MNEPAHRFKELVMRGKVFYFTAAVAMVSVSIGCRSPDQVGPAGKPPLDAQHAEAARLLRSYHGVRQPIPVYIDGQRVVRQDDASKFNIIDPDRIATIRLLTGAEAESHAGEAGRRGVIWITTKEAAAR
jgi:hypothetical protein